MTTELATIESGVAQVTQAHPQAMKLHVDEAIEHVKQLERLLSSVLKEGRDYGTIPGCGKSKVLFKPGAEKSLLACRLGIGEPAIATEELSGGHVRYTVVMPIIDRASGAVVGQGVGCCSTMESNRRYAELWNDKLKHYHTVVERGDAKTIVEVPPEDQRNSVLKIATKRAFVDGTLRTCALSEFFTQDLDDMAPGTISDRDDESRAPADIPEGVSDKFTEGDGVYLLKSLTCALTSNKAKTPNAPYWKLNLHSGSGSKDISAFGDPAGLLRKLSLPVPGEITRGVKVAADILVRCELVKSGNYLNLNNIERASGGGASASEGASMTHEQYAGLIFQQGRTQGSADWDLMRTVTDTNIIDELERMIDKDQLPGSMRDGLNIWNTPAMVAASWITKMVGIPTSPAYKDGLPYNESDVFLAITEVLKDEEQVAGAPMEGDMSDVSV